MEVLIYREIQLRQLPGIMRESMIMVGGILLILGGLFLWFKGYINWRVPLVFIVTTLVLTFVLPEKVRLAALGSAALAGGPHAFEFILGVLKSREAVAERQSQAASALQGITNQDFGQDAARWARWYRENRDRLSGP